MKRFLVTIQECTEGPGIAGHGYIEVLDFTQAGIFRSVGEEAGYLVADMLAKMYPNTGIRHFQGSDPNKVAGNTKKPGRRAHRGL